MPSMTTAMAANAARVSSSNCFVYGTLMAPDVLQILLGRVPEMIPNAILPNHSRHPVRGRVYPGVIPAPRLDDASGDILQKSTLKSVQGIVLLDITPIEMKCLDWFEDVAYTRSDVQVLVPNEKDGGASEKQTLNVNAYIWSAGTSKLDTSCEWNYNKFVSEHLEWYLESTVKPCRVEIEKSIL